MIDADIKNAFVTPNGKVFVFTGICDVFDDDDTLAMLIGHEVELCQHTPFSIILFNVDNNGNRWLMSLRLILLKVCDQKCVPLTNGHLHFEHFVFDGLQHFVGIQSG